MSGDFYYRVKEPPITSETMPLEEGHPLVSGPIPERRPCAACGHVFEVGDRIVLVPIGPGQDHESRQRARRGGYFAAVCVVAHAACAGAE